MYRAISAHQVRVAWQHLADRDYEYVPRQFTPVFAHSFAGESTLSGLRRTRETQAAWFRKLFRLFPDIEFTVEDVLVRGWPWRTRVVVLLTVDATATGAAISNEIAQTIDLRWGRITRIHNLEDTQRLADALQRLTPAGVDEARATPITDQEVPVVRAQRSLRHHTPPGQPGRLLLPGDRLRRPRRG